MRNRLYRLTMLLRLLIVWFIPANAQDILTIYWTGNEDRWGTSPHHSFSLVPGGGEGTYHDRVRGYDEYHFVYDRTNMEGEIRTVTMNRLGITQHSVTITGIGDSTDPQSGFLIQKTNNENQNYDHKLAGPITVHSGYHLLRDQPGTLFPEFSPITLTTDAVWTIMEGGEMRWTIPLVGSVGLTKEGDGILTVGNSLNYTGDTLVNSGAFGVATLDAELAGNIHFAAGTSFRFSAQAALTVGGTATFADFGIENLINIPENILSGTYPMILGDVDFANIRNVGEANAVPLVGDSTGHFVNIDGGLHLVVNTPFPSAWAHFGVGGDQIEIDTGTFRGYPRYPVRIDTGHFLRQINVGYDGAFFENWAYSYNLDDWVYLPEAHVQEGSSWVFFPESE